MIERKPNHRLNQPARPVTTLTLLATGPRQFSPQLTRDVGQMSYEHPSH